MKTNTNVKLLPIDNLETIQKQIFDSLDVLENTQKEYGIRIKHFIHYIQTHGINHNTYLDYKRFLRDVNTLSVSTKNKYLISAKVFLDGLFRLQLLPAKITEGIKGFPQGRLHKKEGLHDEAINKIQNYCSALEPTCTNLRLKSILALLIFQGLRQVEISRLNITDIDIKNKTAYILGKGQEDKEMIHLHPITVKILKTYLAKLRFKTGALFRSESNHSYGSRLTTKSIREIVRQVLIHLDIDGSTHGFRHFFVTRLIKHYKGELLTVSNIAGTEAFRCWKSIMTKLSGKKIYRSSIMFLMASIYEKQPCKREIYLLSGGELEQEPKVPAKHKAHFGTTLQFFQSEIHIP